MLPKLPGFYVDSITKTALAEDISYIDVSTDLLFDCEHKSKASLIAKEDGVLSGVDVAMRVFALLDSDSQVVCDVLIKDGSPLQKGDVIAKIEGSTAVILKGERTALNILQHMSGIASYTSRCVEAVSGTGVRITDTRKTLPGLRGLQKYAVLCGGGSNHRFNLSQAAMVKDNHIDAYGSISKAVKALRELAGHMVMVEVEVRDLQQLGEAVKAGADVVMLDNMSHDMMKNAVEITAGRTKLEASGNITLENIRKTAETGIDIISLGALTHSVKALDISLVWREKNNKNY